jgi:protoporphyrinogen oxidase
MDAGSPGRERQRPVRDTEVSGNNYWKGHWIKHPAHCNLHGLPTDLVVEIIRDFVRAREAESRPVRNCEEWLLASYGERFARTFLMEYTMKFHTTSASNMSTDWLGPRMYRPELEQVLRGALAPDTPGYHYVTAYRYPSRGGFVSYFNLFLRQVQLKLNHEVVRIDPKSKTLCFANGTVETYDGLISAVPLPELIRLIVDVPHDVQESSKLLACTSCVLVNLGVVRESISDNTVTYFYDQDLSFTRLSFPHLMSPNNVPSGPAAFRLSSTSPRNIARWIACRKRTFSPLLRKWGLLAENDTILCAEAPGSAPMDR